MTRARQLRDLVGRLLVQANKDDVAGLASEIAFRTFLELFPFFIFAAMLGGFVESRLGLHNPTREVLDLLSQSLPRGAADPIRQQLESVLMFAPGAGQLLGQQVGGDGAPGCCCGSSSQPTRCS
jgi:uncharacterized BrkB/YihY/UPF0761 family membrane protein